MTELKEQKTVSKSTDVDDSSTHSVTELHNLSNDSISASSMSSSESSKESETPVLEVKERGGVPGQSTPVADSTPAVVGQEDEEEESEEESEEDAKSLERAMELSLAPPSEEPQAKVDIDHAMAVMLQDLYYNQGFDPTDSKMEISSSSSRLEDIYASKNTTPSVDPLREKLASLERLPGKIDNQNCTVVHIKAALGLSVEKDIQENPSHIFVQTLSKGVITASHNCTSLHVAIHFGQIIPALELINAGSDLSVKNYDGATPLYLAVIHNHIQIAEALINAGANLDEPGINDIYPVLVAAQSKNSEEMLRLLVESGADLKVRGGRGGKETVLLVSLKRHLTCCDVSTETLELLIDHGAEINAQDKEGATALHHAIARGALDCMITLLKKGADPNLVAPDKLLFAADERKQNQKIVESLVESGFQFPTEKLPSGLDKGRLSELSRGYRLSLKSTLSLSLNYMPRDLLCLVSQYIIFSGNVVEEAEDYKLLDELEGKQKESSSDSSSDKGKDGLSGIALSELPETPIIEGLHKFSEHEVKNKLFTLVPLESKFLVEPELPTERKTRVTKPLLHGSFFNQNEQSEFSTVKSGLLYLANFLKKDEEILSAIKELKTKKDVINYYESVETQWLEQFEKQKSTVEDSGFQPGKG